MQLYLLRHGTAEKDRPGLSDAERSLTQEGRRKLREVLRAAAKARVEPTLMIASPLKRAIETAEVAKEVLGYKEAIARSKALLPGSNVEQVWDEVRAHCSLDSLMLVGHNPLFAELSGYLLGSADMEVEFKKGAIMRVDFDEFRGRPKGMLRWYLTPKMAAKRD
jgi:phosphohistidine phosphatase